MKNLKALFLLSIIICFFSCENQEANYISEMKSKEQSGASLAMDQWSMMRSYPGLEPNNRAYSLAFDQKKLDSELRGPGPEQWKALGPKNIGGRTLCIAFDPTDPNLIYAGSASGGLWKSQTGGVGVEAWEPISTGHPVLGVGAIAIDPNESNTIYIGTGEVYNYNAAAPGVINRITRGSYGVGILKSDDGGLTWTKSLDWAYADMRGVSDLKISPTNSELIFAATSHGLYTSADAGTSWTLSLDVPMVTDIEFKTNDANTIYVSAGNMNSPLSDKGIYITNDGGLSWNKMTNGLPSSFTGKSLLAVSPAAPDLVLASVANEFEGIGLYKSEDSGLSWSLISNEDVPRYQGWFAHDVAIDPTDVSQVVYVGVEAWKSENGGSSFTKTGFWNQWDFGQVPVGGPEGPSNYVHADIHQILYHPTLPSTVFASTDGGIFVSNNGGVSWEGRNGGYQTQQFYANFSNSTTDSLYAMGGMQDNATAIFVGDDAWIRVIGGDGMCTGINPNDDQIVYGSYQYMNIARSDNGGGFFDFLFTPWDQEWVVFSAQFEIAPSNPSVLYAGAQNMYKSLNGGFEFTNVSGQLLDGDNPVHSIAVYPQDENILLVSTAPNLFINNPLPGKVFKSTDGGSNFTEMQGLPDRPVPDLIFDPNNSDIAYVVYSGFGGSHVYKTIDAGASWEDIDNGALPDVPTNTIAVDPQNSEHVYIGNDLGVYASLDGGVNWALYSEGLPDATIVMHLSISPSNRKLRVATHGRGVYETELGVGELVATNELDELDASITVYPNPSSDLINISLEGLGNAKAKIEIRNAIGQKVLSIFEGKLIDSMFKSDINELPQGAYFLNIQGETAESKSFNLNKTFIKN